MAVTDSYDVNISGRGVDAADAQAAFETFVLALRTATAEGGLEPTGTLQHTEATTETAEEVTE